MENKYRIIENRWYDKFGDSHLSGYNVQHRKSFLGIKYWKTITHTTCGMGDCYDTPTNFNSVKDAEKFIKEKLCTGTPIDKHKSKVIGEYGC